MTSHVSDPRFLPLLDGHQTAARPPGLATMLTSALIFQRIGYNIGTIPVPVALVMCPLVVLGNFLFGVARISLLRLSLFTFVAVTSALSCAIADPKASPFSGLLYTALYGMFIFCIPVDRAEHERAYRAIVRFICVICVFGIVQYVLQYVISLDYLFSWKSVVPASFLVEYNVLNEVSAGSKIYKSNGFFLLEASVMSQLAARGALISIVLLRDLRYVPLLLVGLLVTYSGTGMILFFAFGSIPLLVLVLKEPRLRPLLIVVPLTVPFLLFGLWEQLNLGLFLARTAEFSDPTSSGYARFTGNTFLFLIFSKAEPLHFLFGAGPGMAEYYLRQSDAESFASGWIKLITEYGVVGFVSFAAFFYACAYQATRRHLLATAFLCHWLILDGNLLVPQHLFVALSMCGFLQLNPAAAKDRRRRNDATEAAMPPAHA